MKLHHCLVTHQYLKEHLNLFQALEELSPLYTAQSAKIRKQGYTTEIFNLSCWIKNKLGSKFPKSTNIFSQTVFSPKREKVDATAQDIGP